jgi:hypothetical protein
MASEKEIEKELDMLVAEVPGLVKLASKSEQLLDFGTKYQHWYSRALKLVELLGHDRLTEFRSYYEIDQKRKTFVAMTCSIQDYIIGRAAPKDYTTLKPAWDIHTMVAMRLMNQKQILASLKGRLGTVLSDVKGHLLAEITDDELATAQRLIKINLRAAGAVAGVVLEAHLQRTAANHSVRIAKKDPTISDLNDPLKAAGVYDIPTWRKIQHLADLRNLCDHKKSREPTEPEINELIAGVAAIVKTIF